MNENKNNSGGFDSAYDLLNSLFNDGYDIELIDFTQKDNIKPEPQLQQLHDTVEIENTVEIEEEEPEEILTEEDTADEEVSEENENSEDIIVLESLNKEKRLYSKVISGLSAAIFVCTLFFFFLLSVTDKDQTVSVTEKRALATKPEFSFSELFNGEWTTKFDNYYSDTFPMRDELIKISKKIETVFTRFSVGEDSSVIVKVEKTDDDFTGEGLVVDDKGEVVTKDEAGEKTTKDANDKNIADDKDAVIQSSILIANKRAMEIFGYYDSMIDKYSSLVTGIADQIGDAANVYSLVAPTSVEFYGTKEYRSGSHSQRDAIESVYAKMGSSVTTIDAYSNLLKHTDDYIYFRTDHHWTARGAYYAYEAFCEVSGQTAKTLESYTDKGTVEGDFLGTLYNETQSDVLASNPDYVEYFMPDDSVEGEIFSGTDMSDPMPFYVVSRTVASTNKYLAFIAGDQPLEKITTGVQNGKKIIVLKESYGNAFVPFLCDNYEEIYVLDPRQLTFNLRDFVVTNEIDDVLFINYSFGMGNPYYTEALAKMDD